MATAKIRCMHDKKTVERVDPGQSATAGQLIPKSEAP